jgi:hypothetical protein
MDSDEIIERLSQMGEDLEDEDSRLADKLEKLAQKHQEQQAKRLEKANGRPSAQSNDGADDDGDEAKGKGSDKGKGRGGGSK